MASFMVPGERLRVSPFGKQAFSEYTFPDLSPLDFLDEKSLSVPRPHVLSPTFFLPLAPWIYKAVV